MEGSKVLSDSFVVVKPVASMRLHINKAHVMIPCKICGKKMSRNHLKYYVRRIHEKNQRCFQKIQRSFCDKTAAESVNFSFFF